MDTDGSRSTNNEKEHKTARIFLAPLIWLNKGLSALLKKAFGANYADVSEEDVRDLVDALAKDEDEDSIEEQSAEMINNIFEFNDLTAEDVMTHRTNIVGVDINTITLDDLIYLALDMGFSRIPVYEESVDRIIGIVIVKDLLCLVGKDGLEDFSIRDFLRDVSYIPESQTCPDIFKTLTSLRSGMAVVVDEYGGTAGIVTLEDIIEAVMGNIQDEYDDEKQKITKIGGEVYDVDGDADPEDVFELFGVTLPED
ncbi:MAG: CBS domain-containing protein, partial [Oscillospiraceae bacterium]|nr:CBS domain-containing protein [Oscillospiraceae bacterium]